MDLIHEATESALTSASSIIEQVKQEINCDMPYHFVSGLFESFTASYCFLVFVKEKRLATQQDVHQQVKCDEYLLGVIQLTSKLFQCDLTYRVSVDADRPIGEICCSTGDQQAGEDCA